MSEFHLPDDLSRWPSDPFELLGVSRNIERLELRRAYNRLIRKYKPDHSPEQFQRIRTAYDLLRNHIDEQEMISNLTDEVLQPFDDTNRDDEATNNDAEYPEEKTQFSILDIESEADKLWKQAEQKEFLEAYRGLVELYDQTGGYEATRVRLYWLLKQVSIVDKTRDPCDWLTNRVMQQNISYQTIEIYRKEILYHPEEAISVRCDQFVRNAESIVPLSSLIQERWRAASLFDHFQLIHEDLQIFRDQLLDQDPDLWMRLLIVALTNLTWIDHLESQQMARTCNAEIDELSHLHFEFGEELWISDFLKELATERHKLMTNSEASNPTIKAITRIMPAIWDRPATETRPKLLEFANRLLTAPVQVCQQLDRITDSVPVTLNYLADSFDELQCDLVAEHGKTADGYTFIGYWPILEFFDSFGIVCYKDLRKNLMLFCLSHAYSPQDLNYTLSEFPEYNQGASNEHYEEDLIEKIHSDRTLQLICKANRALWT
jgi:DnaJ domain